MSLTNQNTKSSDTLIWKMKTIKLLTEGIGHTCVADSLLCAFKLRKIGAKRVRGYRQLEKQFIAEGGVIGKHYWVEVNGYVFNDNERLNDISSS